MQIKRNIISDSMAKQRELTLMVLILLLTTVAVRGGVRQNAVTSACCRKGGVICGGVICSIMKPLTPPQSDQSPYYYEPGTGRKFRSLSSVDRHLADRNENTTLSETLADLREYNMPLSNAFKIGSHVKSSNSLWKNNNPREKVQSATFNSPPLKINWVIASPGGNSWDPFIGGSLVPESVQQQWCKRYMLSINDGRYIAPNF